LKATKLRQGFCEGKLCKNDKHINVKRKATFPQGKSGKTPWKASPKKNKEERRKRRDNDGINVTDG
jgi:hypothetical protein